MSIIFTREQQQAIKAAIALAKIDMKLFIEANSGNFRKRLAQVKAYFICTSGEAKSIVLAYMDLDAENVQDAAGVLKALDERFFDHNRSSPMAKERRERFRSLRTADPDSMCFSYGKKGHFKADCLNIKLKQKIAKIDIEEVEKDDILFVGGKQSLVPIELARNGLFIKTIAHLDSGANIFGALQIALAYKLSKALSVLFLKLLQLIVLTGYDSAKREPIR
ncbi:hypothetical protein MBM_08702 [Drepanopeziza brunnea f. sp. 'multigermtubi' MB_m1]|uniref:Uncharacterized protein n=1 Tax=Marssonina brunnea f. sp. multigermtubi (strain MB_m1) TaxID=1072389 RepID=K1XLD3_MARBU|nr:uncharacterized protein MBM_08702 [Drepanopeziza brunnea f. sp. 'multigermtubi' MB_m1]EKD13259.1 hypothetical protein MBM_08702 [Drepanopeziza brunnea f. sp. 'multigermtubi' MB_m1]